MMLVEGLDFETLPLSSSLRICSLVLELTFMKASSFRETEQHPEIKRVQN